MKRRINLTQKNLVGMAIGVISPFLIVPLTIAFLAWYQHYPFGLFWDKFLSDLTVTSKFLSLSIIPNLIWFYFFLNRDRYELARGVIIGSALFLPFIVYVNLLR